MAEAILIPVVSATQVRETPLIQRLAKMCFFKTEIVTGIPQKKTEVELSVMPETVASRVATNNAEALVEAGSTQLIRVEPNDSRVDCSNYNPLDVWNMGVQMAALHFQVYTRQALYLTCDLKYNILYPRRRGS